MNGGKILLEHPLAELQANIVKVFVALPDEAQPVSYTHLDVYKRQPPYL